MGCELFVVSCKVKDMQFQVPQFIEVEDKIFGPLTFKQFLYLAGGAGLCFILYRLLPWYLAWFLILPTGALALALAFYEINNKPFIFVMEAAFRYYTGQRLYLWQKRKTVDKRKEQKEEVDALSVLAPRLSDSKLKDLSWSLDINEKLAKDYKKRP